MPNNFSPLYQHNETTDSNGQFLISTHQRITETDRIRFLSQCADFLYAQGWSSEAIYQRLLIQNQSCHPPLPTDQIRVIAVIRSIAAMSINGYSAPIVNALVPVNHDSPLENPEVFSETTQALTVSDKSNVIPLVQRLNLCLREPEVIIVQLRSAAMEDEAAPLNGSDSTADDSQTANPSESRKVFPDGYYYELNSKTYRKKEILVANFVAWFTEIVYLVDGHQKSMSYVVEGQLHDKCALPKIEISSDDLNKSDWAEKWHPSAWVYPTQQRHLVGAMRQFSASITVPSRTIYRRSGWYEENGQFIYFHGTGAISASGVVPNVEVALLHETFAPYSLPTPPAWEQLPVILNQVVQLTHVIENAGYLILALVARAVLNEVYFANFIVYIIGVSGSFKTSVAMLALMFYGDFKNKKQAPANWYDTDNALERKLHDAKDTLLLIDEHTAHTAKDRQQLLAKSARITMNIGNATSRSRLNSSLELQDTYSPRGFIIGTGEEMPCGLSAIARTLMVKTEQHPINLTALTESQAVAAQGGFRLFMAAYIQWLAPKIGPLKEYFPRQVESWRNKIQGSHPRHADTLGHVMAGLELMQDFFDDVNRHTGQPVQLDLKEAERQLRSLVEEQEILLNEQDNCQRFLSLLVNVFETGKAHLELETPQNPLPAELVKFGWEYDDSLNLTTQGTSIGYVDVGTGKIYLDGEAAYGAVSHQAKVEGRVLGVPQETLLIRMREKGLIYSTREGKKTRNYVRKSFNKQYRWWVCMDIATLYPD